MGLCQVHMLTYRGVQAGKTTGDSVPEGICSDDGGSIAVGLQRYYMLIVVL